jgi:hypothetical protein
MEYFAEGISSLVSIFVLVVFIAGVMKLFQIHTVLMEIKDSLKTTPVASRPVGMGASSTPTPAALREMQSGEDMLRALDAQIKLDSIPHRRENVEQ